MMKDKKFETQIIKVLSQVSLFFPDEISDQVKLKSIMKFDTRKKETVKFKVLWSR